MVYHEEKGNKPYDPGALFINKKLGALMVSRFPDLFTPAVKLETLETITQELNELTYYDHPEMYRKLKESTFKFLDECNDITPEAKEIIKAGIISPPARDKFILENGMVIADFYVRYL